VPLPLLPVVGACAAGCRPLLLLVELSVVVVDVAVLRAVADEVDDAFPA
jgi:hypothetical protein